MREVLRRACERGIQAVVSGDIFLEDVRANRETRLAEVDLAAIFPFWDETPANSPASSWTRDTGPCACAQTPKRLGRTFVGRSLDTEFFASLAGAARNVVRIWDTETGQQVVELHGHTLTVGSLAWSPDGRCLASGETGHALFGFPIRLWEARGHRPPERSH